MWMRRLILALSLLALLCLAAPASSSAACGAQAARPSCPNPLLGQTWFVDREWGAAWRQYRSYLAQGRTGEANLIMRIARQPIVKKFGRWDGPPRGAVSKYLARVRSAQPGAVPLLQVMRHEGEQCHRCYLGGGRRGDAAYRRWIRGLAAGIGGSRVVITFEPDSMGTVECLARSRRGARLRMLAYGIKVLSRLPGATVYVDAGAGDWDPAGQMARKLRKVGIRRVRGFMLNATHYASTRCNAAYGRRISRALGGKPFIINTSENGNGSRYRWVRRRGRRMRIAVWCNPPNTKLGERPTARTGRRLVDAYMWVGRPGYSTGPCNGGPPAGSWWPARALAIAARSGY